MASKDHSQNRQKIPEKEAAKNPLSEIETDIRNLMKRCGSLSRDLEESQQKCEKDTQKMLLGFVEVADAFDNVFRNIRPKLDAADQQTKIWLDNFQTVYELLQRAMGTAGITPIEAMVGQKVNPHWHNVFEVVERPGKTNGIIVEEIKKGYLWRNKLLRAADVKAVRNPS
jgi:molecular chaperone GrpE